MARRTARPAAPRQYRLEPLQRRCGECGRAAHVAYHSRRAIMTLDGLYRLTLVVRRCQNPACPWHHRPYRPEEEGGWALPHGEFGLDVIAQVGALRYAEQRSVPAIHQHLVARGLQIAERTVTHLVQRSEELVALRLGDQTRVQERLAAQNQVILAPGALWAVPAAGRRARGVVGPARRPLRGDPAGAQPRERDAGRSGGAAARGQGGAAGADSRGHLRRAAADPHGGGAGAARGTTPVVPLPFPARGGEADLRGRSACEGAPQEGSARGAPPRARARRPGRRRSAGPPRRLPGGAECAHRRWAATAVRLGAEAARPPHRPPRLNRAGGGKRGLPVALGYRERLLGRGLAATAADWPAIRIAYGWVHQAAHLLAEAEDRGGATVRADYATLLLTMTAQQATAGALAPAVDHFRTVTASDEADLFHSYDVPDLPPTNNALEQCFGAVRYHERRTTGRKGAVPGLVVRGAVRVVAAVATRQRPFAAEELQLTDLAAWHDLRDQLRTRQAARCAQFRFRKDPDAYLQALEDRLSQPRLPT